MSIAKILMAAVVTIVTATSAHAQVGMTYQPTNTPPPFSLGLPLEAFQFNYGPSFESGDGNTDIASRAHNDGKTPWAYVIGDSGFYYWYDIEQGYYPFLVPTQLEWDAWGNFVPTQVYTAWRSDARGLDLWAWVELTDGGTTNLASQVPEPSMFALMLVGLGVVGVITRRRSTRYGDGGISLGSQS